MYTIKQNISVKTTYKLFLQRKKTALVMSLAFVLAVSGMAVINLKDIRQTQAAPVDESCFGIDYDTGYVKLYYFNGTTCPADFEIPSVIDGVTIIGIGGSFGNTSMNSVIIPNSVTHINDWAFSVSNLTSVVIPNSVTYIGERAFQANELTSVDIPDSVTHIGDYAFIANNLTNVAIGNSVSSIGEGAFSDNELTTLSVPDSVISIGREAFEYNQLVSLTLGSNVSSIGANAFSWNQLLSATIPDSVIDVGEGAFSQNNLESVTIPSSLAIIRDGVFSFNNLTSVSIPNSVTSIGAGSFGMNKLSSVTIPDSVTDMDTGAFYLNSLTSVTIPNSITMLPADVFGIQSNMGRDLHFEIVSGDPVRTQSAMDEIWYVKIYTADPSNPNNLTSQMLDESFTGGDLNNNGRSTDSLGGYIINPSYVSASYKDLQGNDLSPPKTHTGSGLTTYLAKDNPTNDLALYYKAGGSDIFTPPAISGYITPAAQNKTFVLGANTVNFVYQVEGGSDDDNNALNDSPKINDTGSSNDASIPSNNTSLADTGSYIMASSGLALFISAVTLIAYKLRPKIRKYILPRA